MEKERLKEKILRKIEALSEDQLKVTDTFLEFLLEDHTTSGNWYNDPLLKKLDAKRRNDRTRFL
jgi:hypothetical protein